MFEVTTLSRALARLTCRLSNRISVLHKNAQPFDGTWRLDEKNRFKIPHREEGDEFQPTHVIVSWKLESLWVVYFLRRNLRCFWLDSQFVSSWHSVLIPLVAMRRVIVLFGCARHATTLIHGHFDWKWIQFNFVEAINVALCCVVQRSSSSASRVLCIHTNNRINIKQRERTMPTENTEWMTGKLRREALDFIVVAELSSFYFAAVFFLPLNSKRLTSHILYFCFSEMATGATRPAKTPPTSLIDLSMKFFYSLLCSLTPSRARAKNSQSNETNSLETRWSNRHQLHFLPIARRRMMMRTRRTGDWNKKKSPEIGRQHNIF